MGKNFDRELKIMQMAESILVHNPDMDTAAVVKWATEFYKLRERRLNTAVEKDNAEKQKESGKLFTELNQERPGVK